MPNFKILVFHNLLYILHLETFISICSVRKEEKDGKFYYAAVLAMSMDVCI